MEKQHLTLEAATISNVYKNKAQCQTISDELGALSSDLTLRDTAGMSYNPLTKTYALSKNVDVNYLVHGQKAALL